MASKPKPTPKTSDTKLVRELAEILNDTDLTEIEMKKGDLKIRVSKGGGGSPMMMQAPAMAAAPAAAAPAAPSAAPAPSAETPKADHPGAVKSPMVGTVYVRPSPDAEEFAAVGSKIKEGDTIMLVEAMKTFNPITAPKSGVLEAVFVQDTQPVEYGDVLFTIG